MLKKITLVFSLLLGSSTVVFAQCNSWIEASTVSNGFGAWSVTTDSANNVYSTGSFTDTISFGDDTLTNNTGGVSYYVNKFDSSGQIQWAIQLESDVYQGFPPVIYQKNGSIYVAGTFYDSLLLNTKSAVMLTGSRGTMNYFLLKLDLNGNLIWAQSYKGAPGVTLDAVYGITINNYNQVYFTGMFQDTATFGSQVLTSNDTTALFNLNESFLTKTDSGGNVIWAIQSTTTDSVIDCRAWGITTDKNENVLITGNCTGNITFGAKTFNANDIANGFSPYFAKFDSSGECEWITGGQGSISFSPLYMVTTDPSANIYIAGVMDSTITYNGNTLYPANGVFYYAKYTSTGNLVWIKQAGNSSSNYDEAPSSLVIDKSNHLWMSGWLNGLSEFGNYYLADTGMFIAEFDTTGTILNAIGSEGTGSGYSSALDDNGNLYVGCSAFVQNLSFNGSAITVPEVDTNGVDVIFKYCASTSAGTPYYPMFGYNHLWYVDFFDFPSSARTQGDNFWYRIMDASGDTTMFNKQYFKARIAEYDTSSFVDTTFFFRENTATQQVWILTSDNGSEKLLYDFSLQKGDSVYLSFDFQNFFTTGWYFVDSARMVNIYAGPRKELFLSYPNNIESPEVVWIEQVGSTILPDYLQRNEEGQDGSSDTLLCSYDETVKIYHNKAFDNFGLYLLNDSCMFHYNGGGIDRLPADDEQLTIYPNPSWGEVNIISTKNVDDLKVFNLLGQLVYESQPQQTQFTFELKGEGMYFITATAGNEIATSKVIVSK